MPVIRAHLEMLADFERGFGPAKAVLAYGRQLFPIIEEPNWLVFGAAKQCYKNAAHTLLHRDDVVYVEGYAIELDTPVPIQHAWLLDQSNKVIDPTWVDSRNCAYFGVPFKGEFVKHVIRETESWSGVLADPNFMRREWANEGIFQSLLR